MARVRGKLPPGLTFGADTVQALARLREIVLYIASRCQTAERFGVVKLNKILLFADFTSFARHGKPITGVEYMRQPNGPVPRRMKPVLRQLEREKAIAIQKIPVGRNEEHRVVALRAPDLDLLSARDVALIDEVISLTWNATGTAVSDFSHGRAWEVAGEDRAAIPYEAAFLADGQPSAAQVARTRELNRKYGWEEET